MASRQYSVRRKKQVLRFAQDDKLGNVLLVHGGSDDHKMF